MREVCIVVPSDDKKAANGLLPVGSILHREPYGTIFYRDIRSDYLRPIFGSEESYLCMDERVVRTIAREFREVGQVHYYAVDTKELWITVFENFEVRQPFFMAGRKQIGVPESEWTKLPGKPYQAVRPKESVVAKGVEVSGVKDEERDVDKTDTKKCPKCRKRGMLRPYEQDPRFGHCDSFGCKWKGMLVK